MTVFHQPQTLEMNGPYNVLGPLVSVFLAFLPVVLYTFSRIPKVAVFISVWYILNFYLARFPLFESPTAWDPANDFGGFTFLSTWPFVGILLFYFGLYRPDAKVQELIHSWPAHYTTAHQFYRVSGSLFWYLYFNRGMHSYFNLQTGFLDLFVGLTAIPLGYYIRNKPLSSVKNLMWYWHAVGLFDLLACFSMASANFMGMYPMDVVPAYLGFAPITLICYFQVPWAMGTHLLYLTSMDKLIAAQENGDYTSVQD